MSVHVWEGIFWACMALLAYAYAGYPLLISVLAKRFGRPVRKADFAEWPKAAVALSVHGPAEHLKRRLSNLLEQSYPGALSIYVGFDGAREDAAAWMAEFPGVQFKVFPERIGKSAVLNRMLPEIDSEIVVLTDERQQFGPGAIRELVANFSDASVGAVSGEYFMVDDGGGALQGVGLYWRLEKHLRRREALYHSSVGATGAIYAIRRSAWRAIPDDALIDDVSIPLLINAAGLRTVFDETAIATDRYSETLAQESARKTRTMAGNFQIALNPKKYGNPYQRGLLLQYLSHKGLRLLIPLILCFVFTISFFLMGTGIRGFLGSDFYGMLFVIQGACYVFGVVGITAGKEVQASRILSIPATYLSMNLSVVKGLMYYLSGRGRHGWGAASGVDNPGIPSGN